MNPLLTITLIGAGVILLSRLGTAGAADRLKFVFQKISAEFKDALSIQINVDIAIQNPTSTSFIIKSFAGDLFVNDYYIGNVSNFTATQITGNTQTTYRVAIQVSTLSLPAPVISILQNFTGLTAKLDGTINVDDLGVPLTLEYKAL